MTNLTTYEAKMLGQIANCELHDGNDPTDAPIFLDYATDGFGTSAGGVMASLCKKGLAGINGAEKGDEAVAWVTPEGMAALRCFCNRTDTDRLKALLGAS